MIFLFVIDNLSTGGAQRQMVNLALGLTQRGDEVEFFCYEPGDLLAQPIYNAGIKVHWHIKHSRFSLDVLPALQHILQSRHFDLILSFLPTANFYAILASRFLRFHHIPVVVSERRGDLPQGPANTEKLSRQFYRFATHVVTNSHHQRLDLENTYPWLRGHISTIYNGYDLNVLAPAHSQPEHVDLHILVIASVSPHKNGLCLVDALNILRIRDQLTPQVDWVGQLVMKSFRLEYLKKMRQKIDEYKLEDQWHWLEQRTDIVEQLHSHDVLIHPSYTEGLPNVVCEALACARPVIVSNTLDHPRLVQNGLNGYLFDYRNPVDLADKIKMFHRLSADKRRAMGLRGRQYAEANLSLDTFTHCYEKLFLDILN